MLVITTLQRSVPPPPLIELLHWFTAVTGSVREEVVSVQAAVGSPAAPWHSWTVTVADPPVAVMVLTIVIWQISPRPPVLSTPLLHDVVAAIVAAGLAAAATGAVVSIATGASNERANSPRNA